MKTEKSKGAILLNANEEIALEFIDQLEKTYLPAVSAVSSGLKQLGIDTPSKSLIFGTIHANYEQLDATFHELTNADVMGLKSAVAREEMQSSLLKSLERFKDDVVKCFSGQVGNTKEQYANVGVFDSVDELFNSIHKIGSVPMSDPGLDQFIEVDEAGCPFVPDQAKQSIIESFKHFLDDPKELKIYAAQEKAAQALEDLIEALSENGIDIDLNFGPQLFFWRYFESKNDEAGKCVVSARIQGIRG